MKYPNLREEKNFGKKGLRL